ncbi:hypothetical protein CUU64_03490 [Bacillus sp. V5-8f]|nr:hypothetical protein CUU64_03490 [Bacillus sp. V5-8f]
MCTYQTTIEYEKTKLFQCETVFYSYFFPLKSTSINNVSDHKSFQKYIALYGVLRAFLIGILFHLMVCIAVNKNLDVHFVPDQKEGSIMHIVLI